MDLPQDNFDRARGSARGTLTNLASDKHIVLNAMSVRTLQEMAWDLEAIQAAVRLHLNHRMPPISGTMDMS